MKEKEYMSVGQSSFLEFNSIQICNSYLIMLKQCLNQNTCKINRYSKSIIYWLTCNHFAEYMFLSKIL
jgi:hypothetical protein